MTAIIDYDTGNLRSVAEALRRAGAEFTVTADPATLLRAERVIRAWAKRRRQWPDFGKRGSTRSFPR